MYSTVCIIYIYIYYIYIIYIYIKSISSDTLSTSSLSAASIPCCRIHVFGATATVEVGGLCSCICLVACCDSDMKSFTIPPPSRRLGPLGRNLPCFK